MEARKPINSSSPIHTRSGFDPRLLTSNAGSSKMAI
nr:MAG TPA: hypothetical protein [Caudoviricetes sp.]